MMSKIKWWYRFFFDRHSDKGERNKLPGHAIEMTLRLDYIWLKFIQENPQGRVFTKEQYDKLQDYLDQVAKENKRMKNLLTQVTGMEVR